jgi:ligand-binding sensor domain-containing protein
MMAAICKSILVLSVLLYQYTVLSGQILRKDAFRLDVPAQPGLTSNSINDVLVYSDTLWLGNSGGLSRTTDNGLSFESFTRQHGLGKGGVSGLAVSGEVVWVATGFDTITEFGSFQAGGGLAYSTDDGLNWTFVPQPVQVLGTTVNNITFDIALRGDEVWITSFAGSLQRSKDFGNTWEIIPPDSFVFDVNAISLNHRAFSVITVDSNLWVGTAEGINRSTDGGSTWTNFSHQNQPQPVSGNFVVGLARQKYNNRDVIWAATRETTSESQDTTEFRGVSWSEDQGLNWRTALEGETAFNIAFDDSVVYVATERGLFKSIDDGQNWALFPPMRQETDGRQVLTNEVFDAGVSANHTLWAGTGDGLAKTADNGRTWNIVQVFSPAGKNGEPRTYAYPNPFSPNVHNTVDGQGHVRFQYNTIANTQVTLRIFDFSMRLVSTIVAGKPRAANGDFYEIWNGLDRYGETVANGVYFYELVLTGDGSYWGKVIVLN